MQRKQHPAFSFTYREGRYFDIWSIVHFSTGVLLGALSGLITISEVWLFLGTVTLLILWEMFEAYIEVGEFLENIFTDILLALVGYAIARVLLPNFSITTLYTIGVFSVIVLILDFFGLRAYMHRKQHSNLRETVRKGVYEKKTIARKKHRERQKNT